MRYNIALALVETGQLEIAIEHMELGLKINAEHARIQALQAKVKSDKYPGQQNIQDDG